jgi:hypothetical protein
MEVPGIAQTGKSQAPGRRPRLFTLEHANRTLPLVRRIVADIIKRYKRICALEERCQGPIPEGADATIDELRRQYGAELDVLRQLAGELVAIGCELKDVRRGIVDFRALHGGRMIEFCWRHGEESIQFWHELDDGFHDRRRIDPALGAELAAAGSTPA